MFIDTHCHINMMLKTAFDQLLTPQEIDAAKIIQERAMHAGVSCIINVGTSMIENQNCISLAQQYDSIFATVGIHPNDATDRWKDDIKHLRVMAKNYATYNIVGIGECGIDRHYKNYNLKRQQDVFKAQIEIALEYHLGLVIHSRDAADETLNILSAYDGEIKQAVMHCFSYDQSIAQEVIARGFFLGIGGTVTYPKNETLRLVVHNSALDHIVLETDAPFLPPQQWRGTQNSPEHIHVIAQFIAELKETTLHDVAQKTTANAQNLFNIASSERSRYNNRKI